VIGSVPALRSSQRQFHGLAPEPVPSLEIADPTLP
jgi:hypothetical protein